MYNLRIPMNIASLRRSSMPRKMNKDKQAFLQNKKGVLSYDVLLFRFFIFIQGVSQIFETVETDLVVIEG